MDNKSGITGKGGTPRQEPTKKEKPIDRNMSTGAQNTRRSGKTETEKQQPPIRARTLEAIFHVLITEMKDHALSETTDKGGKGTVFENKPAQLKENVTKDFEKLVINNKDYFKIVGNCKLCINEIHKMKGVDAEFKLALLKAFTDKLRDTFTLSESLDHYIKDISKNLNLTVFQSFISKMKAHGEITGKAGEGTVFQNERAQFQKDIKEAFNAFVNEHNLTIADVENFADEIKNMKGASTEFKLSLLDMLIRNEGVKKHEILTDYIQEISEELKGYNLKPLRQIVQKNVDYIKDIKTKLTNTTSYYSGDTLPKSITNLLGSHQNIQGATFNNLNNATKLLTEIENHLKQRTTEFDSNEAIAADFLNTVLNADSSNPFLKVGEAFQYYQELTEELAKSHTTTFNKTTFVEQMQKIDAAYNAVFPKLEELVNKMPDSKQKEELIKLLNESKKQKTYFDEAVKLIQEADITKILDDLKTEQGKQLDTTESIVKKAFAIAAVGLIIASVAALIAGLLMSGIGAIILLILVGGLGLGLAATFGTVGFAKISVHGRQIDAAQEAFEELSKLLKTSSEKSPPVAPKIMSPPKTPPANDNPWELST